jgi:hypothetical protein
MHADTEPDGRPEPAQPDCAIRFDGILRRENAERVCEPGSARSINDGLPI